MNYIWEEVLVPREYILFRPSREFDMAQGDSYAMHKFSFLKYQVVLGAQWWQFSKTQGVTQVHYMIIIITQTWFRVDYFWLLWKQEQLHHNRKKNNNNKKTHTKKHRMAWRRGRRRSNIRIMRCQWPWAFENLLILLSFSCTTKSRRYIQWWKKWKTSSEQHFCRRKHFWSKRTEKNWLARLV